jgi:hypothetical protein
MLRALLITPIALLLTASIGLMICNFAGVGSHPRDLLAAAAIALLATFVGAVPLYLARSADQATASQAGLLATVTHLFVAIVLAGVMTLVARVGQPFAYWLFAFYFTTLIGVAFASVRLINSAPLPPAAAKH